MRTILLIEDEPDMRAITEEILQAAGYAVICAIDGQDGVDKAMAQVPDLVLCDIQMPGMDGYEVLRTLCTDRRTSEVPFVFVSAMAARADVRKGMDHGADDYLTKPFTAEELLSAVRSRLERSDRFRTSASVDQAGLDQFFDEARELEALRELGAERATQGYAAKDLIYAEGDEQREVLFVVRGKVRTYKVNRDGKEFVTGLHGPGGFLGYLAVLEGGRATETAQALEPTELALIPRDDMFALLYRDRDVSMRFIRMVAHAMQEKEAHLLELAYASVRQRVARSLLRVHDRYASADAGGLGVLITREHLASIVGIATESLIRCLSDLRQEGSIAIDGRDIRLLDRPALEKLAHR